MFYDSLSKRWAMCLASESILMAEAIMDWQWTLLYPIGSFLDMEKRWRKLSSVRTCVVDRCLYLFLHLFSHYHIGPKSRNTILIIWKKGFQCKGNKGLTVAHPLQRSTPWTFQTTGTHGQTNGDDKPLKSRSNLKPWPRRGFQMGTHTLEALAVVADDLTKELLLKAIGGGSLASDEEKSGVPGGVRSLIMKELIKKTHTFDWR